MLAQQGDGEDGREHRHQVDVDAGAPRADQVDAAQPEDLRDERGEDCDVQRHQEALQRWQAQRPRHHLVGHQRQRRQRRDQRQQCEEHRARHVRPLAQRHRIEGVEHARHDHHHVAAVPAAAKHRQRVSARGHHQHADRGRQHADELQRRYPRALVQERPRQHEHRNRALQDAQVDGAGVVGGDIEHHVEGGEAERGHQHDGADLGPDRGPVPPHLGAVDRPQHGNHQHPAQRGQHQRGDLIHRQPARDRIAGPEQRRQRQQQRRRAIEPVSQACEAVAH